MAPGMTISSLFKNQTQIHVKPEEKKEEIGHVIPLVTNDIEENHFPQTQNSNLEALFRQFLIPLQTQLTQIQQTNLEIQQSNNQIKEENRKLCKEISELKGTIKNRVVVNPGDGREGVCMVFRCPGGHCEITQNMPFIFLRISTTQMKSRVSQLRKEYPQGLVKLMEIKTPNSSNLWAALTKSMKGKIQTHYNRFRISDQNTSIDDVLQRIQQINNEERLNL